jgi:hypothetical protein
MKTPIVAFGCMLLVAASSVYAAESGSRTYGDPSCSDRNANSADCVIQDGPARRSAFGEQSKGNKDTPPAPTKPEKPSATGAQAGQK